MANVVRMPGISADADSAILVEWAVAVGASIRKGEVIATVETDKAVVDIEADADGTVQQTFAEAGDSVDIGGPMALLLGDGEQAADVPRILAELGLAGPADEAPSPTPDPARSPTPFDGGEEEGSADDLALGAVPGVAHTADQVVAAGSADPDGTNGAGGTNGRVFATPLVRRLAAETGVALAVLQGTGPNGRIRRRDLEAHQKTIASRPTTTTAAPVAQPRVSLPPEVTAPTPSATPVAAAAPAVAAPTGGWTDEPATRFRMAVAKGLTASKQNVPHFYLKTTCRFDALLELRTKINASGTTKITINDFVVKAAATALRRVPEMNVSWTGDAVRHFHTVDIGVAMASERGLVVPVLRSADSLSLSALSASVKDFSARAAANTLQQQEMEGGSLTISNLGMYGVEEFSAIINPPQAAILAVGATVPRAVEDAEGHLALAPCVTFVLSVDHRPVDGALAARWLQAFKQLIENPLEIVV